MRLMDNFGLYAILTDPVKGYEYMTALLVDLGVGFVQLRMKETPPAVIRQTAESMRRLTEGTTTKLVINDHPDIAREVGADGVHIGQDDMAYAQVRAIVGPSTVIGISTHTPEQTLHACSLQPDYIGVGPVFATPTKKNADPVIGIEGMRRMLAVADRPAVAIGGIDCGNLESVLRAGAKNFCMVREINRADNPRQVVMEALRVHRDVYEG